MAPEVVLRRGHTYPADVWSLGCVLIEMASGRPPWSNYSKDAKEVLKIIATNEKLPDIPKCDTSLRGIIRQCLQRDPHRRPTASHLLKHSYFQENKYDSTNDSLSMSHTHTAKDLNSIKIIEEQAEE